MSAQAGKAADGSLARTVQLDDDDALACAPGRPVVGPAIHIRLSQHLLDWVDGYARQHHLSRAQAIRVLLISAWVRDSERLPSR